MVIRERYLKLIRPFYDQELIKVLIGIRRSGKSVILKQIIDELKENNVDDNHIIYINFEDYDYEEYTDPKKLNNYVKERIIDDKKYYLNVYYPAIHDEMEDTEETNKDYILELVNNEQIKVNNLSYKKINGDIEEFFDNEGFSH